MRSSRHALIVDIVGSRDLPDRTRAQRDVLDAFARAAERIPLAEPLHATVGDEFQAVADDLVALVWTTGVVRLLLPEGLDVRCGIGRGEILPVASPSDGAAIQDGSAWWNARDAIDEAHRLADGQAPWARTWFLGGDDADVALLGAQLLVRDRIIDSMTTTQRSYAGDIALGATQAETAARHEVTQPAVSQSLRRAGGAALVAAFRLLEGATS
ncbi:SatD family protein [Sanguibacter sp. A247]|uniref:SatD family protein n=1 Tax=unclassified Sanguibacter TaxID=2645534 RepID=UPI003FD8D89F